jgi:hypothetical protein
MKTVTLTLFVISILTMIAAVASQNTLMYAVGMFVCMVSSFRAVCSG